jgi:membrane protein
MAERGQKRGWMRVVQQAADLVAVAQARYGRRLEQERAAPSGRSVTPEGGAGHRVIAAMVPSTDCAPAVTGADPHRSAGAATPDAASAQHEESREKIGDPGARSALPEPHSPPAACRHHVVPQGAWAAVKELFRRYGRDNCPAFAAALSFFSILSIVPMLVVAVAALAYLFNDPAVATQRLQRLIANILPGNYAGSGAQSIIREAHIEASVRTLIRTRGIAGLIGVLSLIWASMQIFVNAAPAMNAAYEVEETRSWIKLRLLALGLLLGAGGLFLLSLIPSSGPDLLRNLHLPWLGLPQHVPWYIEAVFWLVALAINVAMFALIYRFLPNAPTSWREAFAGALLAGLLWELAKQGFSYYLAHFNSYNKIYGTLGSLIVLVLWIYYTSMILLLGVEAAALYRDLQESRTAATEAEQEPARSRRAAARQRARA